MSKKKGLKAVEESVTEVVEEAVEAVPEADPVIEAPAPEKESTVYLGPTITRVVNHGTVFSRGEIPAYIEDKISAYPAAKGLIVPVSDYAKVAREIRLPGSRYRTLYDTISNTLNRR